MKSKILALSKNEEFKVFSHKKNFQQICNNFFGKLANKDKEK